MSDPPAVRDGTDSTDDGTTASGTTANGRSPCRRQVIAAGSCGLLSVFAGCLDSVPWIGSAGPTPTDTPGMAPGTATVRPVSEIHVVGLQYKSPDSSSGYEFFVGLQAPEANGLGATWWQVETLGREKIARKTFPDPRGGRFTTVMTVEIPENVTAVVVRGHGRKSKYGGRVMLADLNAGRITIEKQGPSPKSFEGYSF